MFLFKKRYWLTATVFIAFFWVLMSLPGTWLVASIQKAVPSLQVSQVSGSFWAGEAEYSQWVDNGHALNLGKLSWRFKGLSILWLSPCVRFSSSAPAQSILGDACVGLFSNKLELKNVNAELPLASVSPFFNLNLEGSLNVSVNYFTLKKSQVEKAKLRLLWQRASFFNGNQWIRLGDVQGLASEDGSGGLKANISHVVIEQQKEPPVKINLDASFSDLGAVKPKMIVQGQVAPSSRSAGLNPMLQLIAEPLADGSYQIDIRE